MSTTVGAIGLKMHYALVIAISHSIYEIFAINHQIEGVRRSMTIVTPYLSLAWVDRSGSYYWRSKYDVVGFVWSIKHIFIWPVSQNQGQTFCIVVISFIYQPTVLIEFPGEHAVA